MAAPTRMPAPLQPLRQRISEARAHTDSLFEMLAPSAMYSRPIPERHRLIFYLGHLESFDWNLLGRGAFDLALENPTFDNLFAFGIDPVGGNLPDDQPRDWPAEWEVRAYNSRARERIDLALDTLYSPRSPESATRPDMTGGTLLHVAIEHRLMHAETLAYLFHQLPFSEKKHNGRRPELSNGILRPHMVGIPAGTATLGLPRHRVGNAPSGTHHKAAVIPGEQQFGWDNEFEEAKVQVPEFAIGGLPITNGEYLEFIRASGYDDKTLWSAEDWNWKVAAGIENPAFWIRRGDSWNYRGMFEEFPLPESWPVYVSHAEASAYARWAGKSLPTEAQWHRAAYGTHEGAEQPYSWGNELPDSSRGNFDFASWDAAPVTSHREGASCFRVFDLLGNGWEWTSTQFAPLPGFEAFPFYPGYSANFFDGKHFVMKGGSQRTAACMLRRSFRNWFQPHYPYVYAKFRCVEN